LIEESVRTAEQGVSYNEAALASFHTIASEVEQTSALIGAVAAATQRQAEGVAQVNLGTERINSVTQSNAATAEESASTAASLAEEAARLRVVLARFALAAAA